MSTIRKCDQCQKVIDNEPFYTIGDIDYTVPGSNGSRLIRKDVGNESSSESIETQSWTSWDSNHFCKLCFETGPYAKLAPKEGEND